MKSKTPGVIVACTGTVLAAAAIIGLTATAQEYVLGRERDVAIEIHDLKSDFSRVKADLDTRFSLIEADLDTRFSLIEADLETNIAEQRERQLEFSQRIFALEDGQNAIKTVQQQILMNMVTQEDLEEAIGSALDEKLDQKLDQAFAKILLEIQNQSKEPE